MLNPMRLNKHSCGSLEDVTGRDLGDADAEDIIEGKIAKELKKFEPDLAHRGVQIIDLATRYNDHEYTLIVNGISYDIQNSNDGNTVYTFYTVIDDLLERAGSEERIHPVGSCSYSFLALLTPEMYDLLESFEDYLEDFHNC
jgi:hypothetical protein